MDDDPDRELFLAWRGGDNKAGDALFLRHFDELNGFLRSKVGEAVEDLVQQIWLKLVQGAADKFAGASTFRAYLFGIARKTFYDHLRTKDRQTKRKAHNDVIERALEDLDVSPFAALAERQEVILFARALRKIPLDFQVLFEFHYWQKLPAPELAEIYGLPEGTIRSRLHRARELVREKIGELASSPEELASTLSGFDTWSERVRASAAWRRPSPD